MKETFTLYSQRQDLHYVLDFPDYIKEVVGNDIQTEGEWTFRRQEMLQLYKLSLNN